MTTATATAAFTGEVETFRQLTRMTHGMVRRNIEGLTHQESLLQPQPAGNCLNWILGHLLSVYDNALPLVEQAPVLGAEALARYQRGSAPLTNPADALPLETLLAAWDEAAQRMEEGIGALTAERLDAPAPFSPNNNPAETVRSLLALVLFHQSYHAGQTGLLRRLAGKEGAIR